MLFIINFLYRNSIEVNKEKSKYLQLFKHHQCFIIKEML